MQEFDWKQRYADRLGTPPRHEGNQAGRQHLVATGCGQPQHLVNALVEQSTHIYDAHIIHLLDMGAAPYATEKFRDRFNMSSFFISDSVRHAFDLGIGNYTPMFLSEIPAEFESGRTPLDVALIS